ncbi:hypothetical protein [Ruegeria faecimaris]|uniref:Uncharacterized protein n=1 Tax=Ruegeria faecimaris TaxID=686389 RepID=A0A521B3C9_9RHOB|nr:hypothetical protein [Ruegeria faecimaris]SMO41559.1 hypothetical protein SAMN06265380_101526 [Ruegeria faecimaris]
MSDTIIRLASKLAEDTMKVMDETGNDRFFMEVGEVIGASSQTLEEAFLTEIRVRMAERKARKFVVEKLTEHRSKLKAIEKQ